MPPAVAPSPVRIDAWVWAVRLYPTRSAAAAACRAGHVRLEGATVKPAHPVHVGQTVRAWAGGRERIVVVRALLAKRVGAAVAAEAYEDRSPAPPPPEERPAVPSRDRGAGRPTKRDRRRTDSLRGR